MEGNLATQSWRKDEARVKEALRKRPFADLRLAKRPRPPRPGKEGQQMFAVMFTGPRWHMTVRDHKNGGPQGPGVFGDRCSTLCVADRSGRQLTRGARAVTVSVTVSGPTLRLSAAPMAETPLLV